MSNRGSSGATSSPGASAQFSPITSRAGSRMEGWALRDSAGDLPQHTMVTPRDPLQRLRRRSGCPTSPIDSPVRALTAAQRIDLENIARMNAENRITQRNSWLLSGVIDVLPSAVRDAASDGSGTNFQRASSLLDASVKVYSHRVDSVHQETYKLYGGLNSINEEDDSGGSGDAASGRKERNRGKKSMGGVVTLEKNVDNLNAKVFDVEFTVDPLFAKTSAAFDEGGAKGLLLNQLCVCNGAQLIFDSSLAPDADTSPDPNDGDCWLSLTMEADMAFLCQDMRELEVCPTFSQFSFTCAEDRPTKEADDDFDGAFDNEGFDVDALDVNPGSFAPGKADAAGGPHEAFPDDVAPLPCDDAFGNDGFDDGFDDDDHDDEGLGGPGDDGEDHHHFGAALDHDDEGHDGVVGQSRAVMRAGALNGELDEGFLRMVATSGDDYAYFDPKLLKNWTGRPEHWSYAKPAKAAAGDAATAKKKGRSRREPYRIDFSASLPDDWKVQFAPPKRGNATMANASASDESTVLPTDMHYDLKMLTTLFTKSNWRIRSQSWGSPQGEAGDEGDPNDAAKDDFVFAGFDADGVVDDGNADGWEVFGADAGNAADSDAGDWGDDGWGAGGDFGGAEESEAEPFMGMATATVTDVGTQAPGQWTSLALVPEPDLVERLHIGYARRAKRVDVKKLKSCIWDQLSQRATRDAEQAMDDSDDEAASPGHKRDRRSLEADADVMPERQDFQQVLDTLQHNVPSSELENISIPFCFICVLHLCNEKTLALEQTGLEDLVIRSDESVLPVSCS